MSERGERFLYAGLDHNDQADNLILADGLVAGGVPENLGFKVNLDDMLIGGTPYYDAAYRRGRPMFVDLKMNNGSSTMTNIVQHFVAKDAAFINAYALADRLLDKASKITQASNTKLLAVTVTTHMTDDYCRKVYRRSLPDTVRMLAEMGLEHGADGIILPGTALDAVEDLDCIKVVPAIRPTWYEDKSTNDQEQPVTPTEAIQRGGTILVCGSPIYKSPDQREAMLRIYEEMMAA